MRRDKKLPPLLAVLLVLAVGFGYRLASGAEGDISVDTKPQMGTTLSVSIEADIGSKVLSAYAFTLNYDPAALSIASTDSNGDGIPDAVVSGSPQFGLPSAVNFNNAQGTIRINDFQTDSTAPKGLVKVVTINFNVIGNVGTTTSLTLSNVVLSDSGSNAIASNPIAASVIVQTNVVPIVSGWSFFILLIFLLLLCWILKKKRGLYIIIMIFFAASLVAIGHETSFAYPLGDVNGDGIVNVADALLIAKYDAGLIAQFTDPGGIVILSQNADVTGTPKGHRPDATGVDIIDALLVAQLDVGLVSNFPAAVFRAMPSVFPTTGNAPLKVTFTEKGDDPESTIEYYRWDFNGDGTYDHSWDPVAITHTYTYSNAGTYHATLQVKNSKNEIATAAVTITVNNSPPKATADANPSNGPVPLTVNFTGTGTDADGSITLYEWDFDGDGTYDYTSTSTGNTSYTYTSQGTQQAIFRVTDNNGAKTTASVVTTAIHVGPSGTPVAKAKANVMSGNAPLTVNFSDGGSTDDGAIVKYEWDFESDDSYDYSSTSTASTSHTFTNLGTFTVTYRVTDNTQMSSIDQLQITVNVQVSLSRAKDTINPLSGETTGITTSINAPSPVSVIIRDQVGSTIRTLVNQTRNGGSYTDIWDGKDDDGNVVNDGIYYTVLQYTTPDGATNEYDLTKKTGGSQYTPYRYSVARAAPADPFADSFLPVIFRLDKASEVTLFVGVLYTTNTRIRTILNRVPLPKGTHTIYWDGLDDQGNIAKPPAGNSLILGIWGYYLPDNAICVTGGTPILSNVAAEPNYYSPFSEKCDGQGKGEGVTLTYDLSEAVSKVTLQVFRMEDGNLVRSYMENNILAGSNSIFWDGKNNGGEYVDIGDYRIGLMATDADGNESMVEYTFVRIDY